MKSRVSFVVFLIAVFISFCSRIWDPDFFWHLNTGRWIVEHRALPSVDPFALIQDNSPWVSFTLQNYWLSQIFYYFIFLTTGYAGFALLKASVFSLIFLSLMVLLGKKGVRYPIILFVLLPLFSGLLDFRGDRPQMFTFLGFALLVMLIEIKKWEYVPLLMLVWANAHSGYIIGLVVISVYIVTFFLNRFRRIPADNRILTWGVSGFFASFLNPNTYKVLPVYLASHESLHFQNSIEYLSPFVLAARYHDYYISYFFLLLSGIGILIWGWKKTDLAHVLLFIFTAAISLKAGRYIPFLLMQSCVILALRLDVISKKQPPKIVHEGIPVVLALFLCFYTMADGNSPRSGISKAHFPEEAVEFIAETVPPGNLFNNPDWGGYISWSLPSFKVFSDTRHLSEVAMVESSSLLYGEIAWQDILNAYSIDTIITSSLNTSDGSCYILPWMLLDSPDWRLVFTDKVSLVFVRNNAANAGTTDKYSLPRDKAHDQALTQALSFVERFPDTPMHWSSLGTVYFFRKQFREAADAYRKALALNPDDSDLRHKLQLMEKASGG